MTRPVAVSVLPLLILFSIVTVSAQWTQTSGPLGGSVPVILVDGTDIYAGTYGAGLFKSTDDGLTWQQKNTGIGYQTIVAIAKCGPYLLASGTEGFYRSSNGGDSWTPIPGFGTLGGVSSIASQGTHAIAGTSYGGVYISTDTGATWAPSNAGFPLTVDDIWISSATAAGSSYIVYGGTWDSAFVHRSTDLGASWHRVDSGAVVPTQINEFYFDGDLVYAAGASVYSTTNSGMGWEDAAGGLPAFPGINAFVRSGTKLFAGGYTGLFFSIDSGGSWTRVPGRLEHLHTLSLASTGTTLLAGTDGDGIYRSTDNGVTWTGSNEGLLARGMSSFIQDGSTLYANGRSIFKTGDGGDTWAEIRGNFEDSAAAPNIVFAGGDTLFAMDGAYYYHLARSVDGGATWSAVWPEVYNIGLVQRIVRTGSGFWTAVGSIYRSTDDGNSWNAVDSAATANSSLYGIGVYNGSLFAFGARVFRSTDDGSSWEEVTPMSIWFGQADMMAAAGANLFLGDKYNGMIWRSTDGGSTWGSAPVPQDAFRVDQLHGSGSTLYFAGDVGVHRSTDAGNSWSNLTAGLPQEYQEYSLAVSGGYLLAGTGGNSVWRRPIPVITSAEDAAAEIPAKTALAQNYPNPFNPSTMIAWYVASVERISLKVYDVLGREVATLFDGVAEPGKHSVAWEAGGLPGGVYFVRMAAGSTSDVRSIVLLR